MTALFIVGCGRLGRMIARRYIDQNRAVSALVRSATKARELDALGVTPVRGDLDDASTLTAFDLEGGIVHYLAPPPASGSIDSRMANFLAAIDTGPHPRRILYVSTSGVYGDHGGAWVDEDTPPNPHTDRAKRRLDAEDRLRAWSRKSGIAVTVLRVGGIYGPGRLPEARLRRAAPMLAEEQCGYSNRIHAEDLTSICIAAAQRSGPSRIYNVSDGHPGNMSEFFKAVARRLGLPPPVEVPLEEARERLSPELMSYLLESRRLDNRRMLSELGVTLRYPNLQAGLEKL